MTDDAVFRMAHAQLMGLKANIRPNVTHREFIDFYHEIIDDLEGLAGDLSGFRVPLSAITMDQELAWCNSLDFRDKVEGLLDHFQVSEDRKTYEFVPAK
ncbi:MAG: hypothetical protein ABIF09_11700 [Gemmatimonadota bacterium]